MASALDGDNDPRPLISEGHSGGRRVIHLSVNIRKNMLNFEMISAGQPGKEVPWAMGSFPLVGTTGEEPQGPGRSH